MNHPIDLAASVRGRLLDLARREQEEYQGLITRYALERLLYRLSRSAYAEDFVLKGAMLFYVWGGAPHRATRDLDLAGSGSPDPARLEQVFRDLCEASVEADGLEFLSGSVRGLSIREDQEYLGVRVRLTCALGKARIPVQVDVGFGDVPAQAGEPRGEQIEFPTILDFPVPRLRAYSREAMISEKFHAMVLLGIANSRMKDFYDVWILARDFDLSGPRLSRGIRATFAARRTPVPVEPPVALTAEFVTDPMKVTQWAGFVRRAGLRRPGAELAQVTKVLRDLLMPVAGAAAENRPFEMVWPPGGPWRARTGSS